MPREARKTPAHLRLLTAIAVMVCTGTNGCIYKATQLVVLLDTDVPASVASTVKACVRNFPDGMSRCFSWRRALNDANAIRLPGSFAVTPAMSGPQNDAQIELTVSIRPDDFNRAPIERRGRFRFVSHQQLQTRIFLSAQCGEPALGCTTANTRCTVALRCEERNLTCGNDGTCVTPELELTPFDPNSVDASMDSATDTFTVNDIVDSGSQNDATDVAMIDQGPVCMASGMCVPAECQSGENRCVGNVPTCVSTGFIPAGTNCGPDRVCNGMGACILCMNGASCMTATPCRLGTINCGINTGTCTESGIAPVDTPCAGGICNAIGQCIPCQNGTACGSPTGCTESIVQCSGGQANCISRPRPDGTACDDNTPCTSNDQCTNGTCSGTRVIPNERASFNQGANGGDGVCIIERFYCSPNGMVQPMAPPGGWYGGGGGVDCDYHACMGNNCQVNFCRSCLGNCPGICP